MRCYYPAFTDEETKAQGYQAKELSRVGGKIQSHICLTSKPMFFHVPVLQALDEVWCLAIALQIASYIPISLRGVSVNYSGERLFSLAWWTRLKYRACLGSWRAYNCRINLAISLLWDIRWVMLAAVLDKPSNLRDLTQWKVTSFSCKTQYELYWQELSPPIRESGTQVPSAP